MRCFSKLNRQRFHRQGVAGITLIECMVFIAVVSVIVGMGVVMFSKMISLNRDLQRNSEDIIRALKAGEQWRTDVRLATGTPTVLQEGLTQALSIPTNDGLVRYRYHQGRLWRESDDTASPRPILSGLAQCEFVADPREQIQAWRWDLELVTKKRTVGIEPLFSFLAVPQKLQTQSP